MAKTCPKCKRPNNDLARRCLYCDQVFAEAPAPVKAAPSAEPAPAPEAPPPEAFLVIVSPAQEVPRQKMAQAGRLLLLDPYTASVKLRSPAPWTARGFADLESGQDLVKELAAAGIDAYLVKQSGLDKISDRFLARGVKEWDEQKIVFLDARGDELAVPFTDIFLVVRGRITERKRRDETPDETEGGVRLGKLGGNEQDGAGDEKGAVRKWVEDRKIKPHPGMVRWVFSGSASEIADFHRKSSPRAVRVVESEFDYSRLGDHMKPSGLHNFNFIFDLIMSGAPQAHLDLTFKIVGYTTPETPKEDRVREDLITKLSAGDVSKKLFDNRAHFDLHSARVYLDQLRASRRKKAAPPAPA